MVAAYVRAEVGAKAWARSRVPDVLVIYIRAVAVRGDWQGKGIGTALVVDALRRCMTISDQMGVAAVVANVLRDMHFDGRWAFYERLGFRAFGDSDNWTRLFTPMADVRATIVSSDLAERA